MPTAVSTVEGDGVLLIRSGHALDIASMPSLTHALRRAIAEKRHVVLDASELQRLAAAPLGAVVSAAAHLSRHQLKLVVVCRPFGAAGNSLQALTQEGILRASSVTDAVLMARMSSINADAVAPRST